MHLTTSEQWDDVLAAVRHLDRIPLRRLVATTLRDVSPPPDGARQSVRDSERLLVWTRLGEAVTTGSCQQLDRLLTTRVGAEESASVSQFSDARRGPDRSSDGTLDWQVRASLTLDMLLAHLPADDSQRALPTAVVLTFCYVEAIIFWEHTTEHEPLVALLDEVARRAASAALTAPHELSSLLVCVERAATALRHQFPVESAWLCASPGMVTLAAGEALEALDRCADALATAGTLPHEEAHSSCTAAADGIHRVLAETITDALLYFRLLHEQIGPAADAFAANLDGRGNDMEVRDLLLRAKAATERVLTAGDDEPTILGVFRTEAQAQARAVESMLAILGTDSANSSATLVVESGEIHYLYPFGLPAADPDQATVQHALVERLLGLGSQRLVEPPTLLGCPVTIEDALLTAAHARASTLVDPTQITTAGGRVVFPEHRLILETAGGWRYSGLEVEVQLGSLGNHLVRITATTEVRTERCSEDAAHMAADHCDGTFEAVSGQWTAHRLDLLLHRGGMDFGPERLRFVPIDDLGSHEPPTESRTWSSIIEMVAELVCELRHAIEPDHGDPTADELCHPGAHVESLELRQHAHVLVVVKDAVSILADGRRMIRTAEELARCSGAAGLFASQPAAPRVLSEWACNATAEVALVSGMEESMDSYIRCNGDTTLMFVPFSPNWQIIEDRELITFALSLGSAYALGRLRLLEASHAAGQLDTSTDPTTMGARELRAAAEDAQGVEQQLSTWVNYAESLLDHAKGAVVVRPYRDRNLLRHISERSVVGGLSDALTSTRDAALHRLGDLRDLIGRINGAERRQGARWVERFLLVVAVLAFVDLLAWFSTLHQDAYAWNWTFYFWGTSFGLALLCVALMLAVRTGRGQKGSGTSRSGSSE